MSLTNVEAADRFDIERVRDAAIGPWRAVQSISRAATTRWSDLNRVHGYVFVQVVRPERRKGIASNDLGFTVQDISRAQGCAAYGGTPEMETGG